jgi:glycosyltransferase involved in cell wall biosynthesis
MLPVVGRLSGEGRRITGVLASICGSSSESTLICTSQNYWAVAEEWIGPVVYYLTDLGVEYPGAFKPLVRLLDRRMVKRATLVCPNSTRVRDYLVGDCGCEPEKVTIVPNATRAANVRPSWPPERDETAHEIVDRSGWVAGVIGNLGENLDWVLLEEVIARTPWLKWVFVGPFDGRIRDQAQRAARSRLVGAPSGVQFVGNQPYGKLQSYARAFDVAVLPYRHREPTYSGSSTRFYEHLAACKPILSTRGFEELLHKEPLLKLVDGADEMVTALDDLRSADFVDGFESLRWEESKRSTWEERARHMICALEDRLESGRS